MRYNDLWFRIIISLLAAHFIVIYGVTDSFFDLLLDRVYYEALFGSFAIALVLVNGVYWITRKLDRKFDWNDRTLERAALQFLAGFAGPGLFAFFLAFIYFASVHTPILKTPYIRFDFPIILILLLLLNVYYLAHYFYLKWKMATYGDGNGNRMNGIISDGESAPVFMVNQGAKNIPTPIDNIAYFFRNEINMLRTFSGEDFVVSQSLDEIEAALSNEQFFRANRQVLVNRNACQHFESLPFNKLELFVEPTFNQQIVVSQKRNRALKEWLKAG